MSALSQIADASRKHTTTCTCGWKGSSATKPGARILSENHQQQSGLRGHPTMIGGAK